MNLDRVSPGVDCPNDIHVIVEIPAHSDPVKDEVDKDTGAMFVDRFMSTAMHYPCNYGYVPHTSSKDNDPMDVPVLTPVPLISGSVVRSRPVGMLKMTDEPGDDVKVLAVPIDALCSSIPAANRQTNSAAAFARAQRDNLIDCNYISPGAYSCSRLNT